MILFIAITIYLILDILLMYFCERYFARKCNYDCTKCKNWHCQYLECERKRKKEGITNG